MKQTILIALIFFSAITVFSQGDLDTEKKILFRNEISYGLDFKSNGWGVNYRFAKRKRNKLKTVFQGDINFVKHPKEWKVFSLMNNTFSRFVFGKTYSVFNLRFSYGKQREMYSKLDINSVSVRFIYSLGVSSIFAKPIYYEVENVNTGKLEIIKYNSQIQYTSIWGKASYFKGINEMIVNPGITSKIGISIDFSKKDKSLSILEFGLEGDYYLLPVEIMAFQPTTPFFPAVYLSLRLGKVKTDYYIKEIDQGEPE